MGAVGREEFKQLVDELEDLETRRSGSGGFANPEDAARRVTIERRLMELVTTEIPRDERRDHVRLPCDLWVQVRHRTEQKPGMVVDVGAGGVFVETALEAPMGDLVDLEIERRPGTLDHGLRVRGKVAWASATRKTGRAGLGIAFVSADEASERRLRRFVIELLRKRLPEG